jgi:hypothetical protein
MSGNELYLIEIASKVRTFFEGCRGKRFEIFCNFPVGCCESASILLGQKILIERGLKSCVIEGAFMWQGKKYTHAWLRCEGLNIDLTADQFSLGKSTVECSRKHFLQRNMRNITHIESSKYADIIYQCPSLSAVWFDLSRA